MNVVVLVDHFDLEEFKKAQQGNDLCVFPLSSLRHSWTAIAQCPENVFGLGREVCFSHFCMLIVIRTPAETASQRLPIVWTWHSSSRRLRFVAGISNQDNYYAYPPGHHWHAWATLHIHHGTFNART